MPFEPADYANIIICFSLTHDIVLGFSSDNISVILYYCLNSYSVWGYWEEAKH